MTAAPARPEPACVTLGCQNPGTVTGMYDDVDEQHRVTYCDLCANAVAEWFTPDRPELGVRPSPADIRARVDAMAPRTHRDGTINASHVAIEQTFRNQHGYPSYIAEFDGPGKFRPEPGTDEIARFSQEAGLYDDRPELGATDRQTAAQVVGRSVTHRNSDALVTDIAAALADVRAQERQRYDDLRAAIQALHLAVGPSTDRYCGTCSEGWPCRTSAVLDQHGGQQ